MKILYTTAEEAYDGFGTKTVESGRYQTKQGKPVRKVSVQDEHRGWQEMRYASGLHLAATPEQFADLLGWFVVEIDKGGSDD